MDEYIKITNNFILIMVNEMFKFNCDHRIDF